MDEIDLNNLDFSESGDESSSSSESDNDPLPLRIHISNLWTATDDEGAGKSGYSLNDIFVVSDAYRTRLTNMRERFRVMMNNYLLDITRLLIAEANDDEDDAEANDDEDGVLWGHLERVKSRGGHCCHSAARASCVAALQRLQLPAMCFDRATGCELSTGSRASRLEFCAARVFAKILYVFWSLFCASAGQTAREEGQMVGTKTGLPGRPPA